MYTLNVSGVELCFKISAELLFVYITRVCDFCLQVGRVLLNKGIRTCSTMKKSSLRRSKGFVLYMWKLLKKHRLQIVQKSICLQIPGFGGRNAVVWVGTGSHFLYLLLSLQKFSWMYVTNILNSVRWIWFYICLDLILKWKLPHSCLSVTLMTVTGMKVLHEDICWLLWCWCNSK